MSKNVYTIEDPMQDDQIETLLEVLKTHDKIQIGTPDIGGGIVQALLCASQDKKIKVTCDNPTLKHIFANPVLHTPQ